MPEINGFQCQVRNDGIYWGTSAGTQENGSWRFRIGVNGPVVERATAAGWASSERWMEFDTNNGRLDIVQSQRIAHRIVTTTYTVVSGDSAIEANATSGAFTITLMSAVSAGAGFCLGIGKSDSTANIVTIDAAGAETIDGDLTYLLTKQWHGVELVSNGTNWRVKAVHGGTHTGAGGSPDRATVVSGATTVVVTHNAGHTPAFSDIYVVPINNMGNAAKFWLSTATSTQFTINVNVDPGVTTAQFAWKILT